MKCILCNSELKSNVYHKVRNNPFKKIYKCNKCQMIQLHNRYHTYDRNELKDGSVEYQDRTRLIT